MNLLEVKTKQSQDMGEGEVDEVVHHEVHRRPFRSGLVHHFSGPGYFLKVDEESKVLLFSNLLFFPNKVEPIVDNCPYKID